MKKKINLPLLMPPKPLKLPWYLKFNPFYYIRKSKLESLQKIKAYQNEISELKYTNKVNLNSMISDLRFFKISRWQKIKMLFSQKTFCLCLIHYPNNVDVLRYFPMPRPFIVDINKNWYLFSPSSFRYINDMAKLEFYANTPFAILHNVSDKYEPPTIDAATFETVQTSKHVTDALKAESDDSPNIWIIICLCIIALTMILTIINMVNISKIIKLIGQ